MNPTSNFAFPSWDRGAKFTRETTLLIQGIKGKINEEGVITDKNTKDDLIAFARAFQELTNT